MKSNYSFIVLMLFLGLCACDKNELESNTEIANDQSKTLDISLRYLWAFVDCSDPSLDCFVYPIACAFPGGNCLPTVVIRGLQEGNDLDELLKHIDDETYDEYFSGQDYKATFGIIDSFPELHQQLKTGTLSFVVQRSDTLERHMYLIGFDSSVHPSMRTEEDVIVAFEIDD